MEPERDHSHAAMLVRLLPSAVLAGLLLLYLLGRARADTASVSPRIDAREGQVEFTAVTNLPALEVHGRGQLLHASAVVRRDGRRIFLQKLEARMPVDRLSTGMSVRDKHMRERVFVRPDGSAPDLAFLAEQAVCSTGAAPCVVTGQLSIRGEPRPFSVSLTLEAVDGDRTVRVRGDGVVKLSDYGIPRPRQLGVTVGDAIAIQIRLVAGPVPAATP
jgi:polyisoprenoid-binding protein YceI